MLDRVVVNVIHVPDKIVLIADRVLQVAPLPKRKFAVRVAGDRNARKKQALAEVALDSPPTSGEIRVSKGRVRIA